jgi:hypothetical protein
VETIDPFFETLPGRKLNEVRHSTILSVLERLTLRLLLLN